MGITNHDQLTVELINAYRNEIDRVEGDEYDALAKSVEHTRNQVADLYNRLVDLELQLKLHKEEEVPF